MTAPQKRLANEIDAEAVRLLERIASDRTALVAIATVAAALEGLSDAEIEGLSARDIGGAD